MTATNICAAALDDRQRIGPSPSIGAGGLVLYVRTSLQQRPINPDPRSPLINAKIVKYTVFNPALDEWTDRCGLIRCDVAFIIVKDDECVIGEIFPIDRKISCDLSVCVNEEDADLFAAQKRGELFFDLWRVVVPFKNRDSVCDLESSKIVAQVGEISAVGTASWP
jgi:hypothetical protein